jgi:EAL domain-containing protein (putative c-di-GMP-specific phosphodiesterase class I)
VSSQLGAQLQEARVVVVDDVSANVVLLRRILEGAGVGEIHEVTDARLAVDRCLEVGADLLLLDLHMPHVDGFTILREVREAVPADEFLPVLVLTADTVRDTRERALDAGANDFLTKPFDRMEVIQRVRNLLAMRAMYAELQRHNSELEAELARQAREQERRAAAAEQLRARVDAAFEPGALSMVFQPIVDLVTGEVVAAEALARFRSDPPRSPEVWFAEAEQAGRGVDLELAAVEAALACLPDLPDGVHLTFNVSPSTVRTGALATVVGAVGAGRLMVELTEHEQIDDYEAVAAALDELRRLGASVAVDDAGAGYAGLKQMLRLRPEVIKLDADITRGINGDPVRRALASSLVSFADETGAFVVAEGIETEDERATVRGLGVRWGQGYLLARPAPLPLPVLVS